MTSNNSQVVASSSEDTDEVEKDQEMGESHIDNAAEQSHRELVG